MDLAEVTVGVEDDSRVSDAWEAIEVWPRRVGRRGDGSEASGALELVRGGPMEGYPQQWWLRENAKLELGCAHFKAG